MKKVIIQHNLLSRGDFMLLKVFSIITLILAALSVGCGMAIHFRWVGEMDATPHIVLGFITLVLVAILVVLTFLKV